MLNIVLSMKNNTSQNIKQSFGKKIQYYRKLKGLTQSQLANTVGKTEETISNIERGLNSTKLEIINNIAEALDVDIMELFNFKEESKIKDRAKFSLIKELIHLIDKKDKKYILGLLNLLKDS
ncbi:MAG: transcriptional regulator with XRE-family HTH domain [Rickettsiales bacterium]|jgi:transcriptional regulator with XRE-family HTH domain